jgi:hypothetical protein
MPTDSFKSFAEFCPFYLAERNKPATFQYPRLSFMGDRWMWWQILTGRIRF